MDNTQWLEGQYFDLLVSPDTDYGYGMLHWFDVYIKTTDGRHHLYGAGGDQSALEWLWVNDTLEGHQYHIDTFGVK